MDPSACRLHPGVAVTGFCPACLRDRLAGLHPPSAADLRRCKSFSYARSAAAVEPQRRSCDLFRHQLITEEENHRLQDQEPARQPHQPKKSSSLGGLLGKKLQQWRRKNKKETEEPVAVAVAVPPPEMEMPMRPHQHRPSCDADPRRASWDARSGPVPVLVGLLPATMLMSSLPAEEDDDDDSMRAQTVPRSDGQIPVEEDYYYYHNSITDAAAEVAVPGGSVQTRDYYLDSSSSSSRRRRSVDRSTTSGRNSFSDANNNNNNCSEVAAMNTRMMMMMGMNNAANGNAQARVSPAAELMYHYHDAHHHQSVLDVHHHRPRHQYCRDDRELQAQQGPNNLRDDGFSGSFRSAFRDGASNGVPASKPNKKGVKGWSIWGLISKKSSSRKQYSDAAHRDGPFSAGAAAEAGAGGGEYPPWPELRARGYNGQMLRCNSSINARSSFSGGGSGSVSGRRSISGVDMRDAANKSINGGGLSSRTRRDEVLLERNLSTRSSSYSRSGGHHDLNPAMAPPLPLPQMGMGMQYHYHHQSSLMSRPPNIPRRSSAKHDEFSSSSLPRTRRSTLGL